MSEVKDYQTSRYWDRRTMDYKNDRRNMLFRDPRFQEYESRTRSALLQWEDEAVLDVCCGFGRFAKIFKKDKYLGFDFSQEMIKIAEAENPEHQFFQSDVREQAKLTRNYDVVFEVNSLHCLGLSPEEFYEKYKEYAKKCVACLEADRFTVFQIY